MQARYQRAGAAPWRVYRRETTLSADSRPPGGADIFVGFIGGANIKVCFTFSRRAPPGLGEHSREVLAEAGLSIAEIDELIAAGVVKQGQPFQVVAIMNYR